MEHVNELDDVGIQNEADGFAPTPKYDVLNSSLFNGSYKDCEFYKVSNC